MIKQLRSEWKNVIVFIGLFIVTIIFSEIFGKIIKFPYRIKMILTYIGFLSESIFLFIGLMLLWKINLKNRAISIAKAILCCFVMTLVMRYIVNWVVGSVLYSMINNISVVGLKYIFLVIYNFINFSVWLLIYVFVCKFVFQLDEMYIKSKKYIIISQVILFILSLVCAFSDLIMSLTWDHFIGTGSNGIFGFMKFFEINSRFDTENLIIFVKCIILVLLGIGLHRNFNVKEESI